MPRRKKSSPTNEIVAEITANGISLKVTGDVDTVNTQIDRFLARLGELPSRPKMPSSERSQIRTFYDAVVVVLHQASRPLTRAEIQTAFEQNGFKLPKYLPQALADTKRWKHFITQAEHGKWRLDDEGKKHIRKLTRQSSITKGGSDDDA